MKTNYEKLIAKVSAPAQMTNNELVKKLQKGISDIYKVMDYVPYGPDRESIYSHLEGIYEIINELAVDGPDTVRYAQVIDEE